ncbi:hypothetical protein CGCTS75_v000191 [Colletotrichum tropicale]|nr:hypothetical protein CGCTS75_v000191 [Colletotrichum tropicale]
MVEVLWKFANDQKRHRLKCWVLPGCTKDFVLGSKFLHMTKTLTAFSHRIKKVFTSFKLRLRLMNEEKQRLSGIFNNRVTSAIADTGSDLMLVSLDYALKYGLSIETGKRHRSEVELADGTRTWTHGTVKNAMWTVGESTVECDFHVLNGLPADIILSKDYLFDLNIFSIYADLFNNLDSVEDLTLLCGIRLVEEEIQDLEKLEADFLRDVTSQDAFDFDAGKRERRRRLLTETTLGYSESTTQKTLDEDFVTVSDCN